MIQKKDYLKEVRDQYEMYPYPMRDPEDDKRRLLASTDSFLDHVNHNCFKGKETFEGFRILVAGGGTGSAAIFMAEQLRERDAEIVYLDISTASLGIAQERANIRGLENIKWVHGSILSLPDLDLAEFDYINCIGVLHHLDDPEAGLRSLKGVLKETGALCIMVYGKYGRSGVYQMQDLMKLVNKRENDMGVKVANTRTVLSGLPASNWFRKSEDLFADHKKYGDIGIYDLFLHSQDRSYSVMEFYDYIENCGLNFISFGPRENIFYRPETYIQDAALLEKIHQLDKKEQSAIAELLAGNIIKHTAYIAPSGLNTIALIEDMDNVPFFSCYPLDNFYESVNGKAGEVVTVQRQDGMAIQFKPNSLMLEIIRYIDGHRSVAEIFEAVRNNQPGTKISDEILMQHLKPLYEIFSRADWMLLRDKSVVPFKTIEELQAPVSARYSS